MRIPEGLVEYSTTQLECMARELYRTRPHISFTAPIDLEFLIESEGNVSLTTKDGLVTRHKVEGCVLKEPMTHDLVVCIDGRIFAGPWPRYNAVLGEEFAHIHLHKALLQTVKSIADFLELQSDPEWERFERDAKRFSRMIRMPVDLIVPAAESTYSRLVNEHGFGDPIKTLKLLRNSLATQFKAEPDDVQRRMLDFACSIEPRVIASVQAVSDLLLPSDWASPNSRPTRQATFFTV